MTILDLADSIYRELDLPDNTSIPVIVFWLGSNLNTLNLLLSTSYIVNEDEEAEPELGDGESAILKHLYLINYYNYLIRSNLGASSYDWSEISEGDSTIRRVSKNEISKSYIQVKHSLEERLQQLLIAYRRYQTIPRSLSATHDLIRLFRI
jgi:hypothetical protein